MQGALTVTELNTRTQGLLRSSPGIRDVWVSGEISNLTRASSGHYYFTLKDPTSEIRCAMFARSRARVDFEPKENMKVMVFGGVDLYVQRGSYQFIVETMRQSGLGELFQAFEELKKKLQAEGLFDSSRKRPLPPYPRTIGVVTSETGAVIHDIITTSSSRFPADILLAPALVQGEGAAATIVAGIRLLNRVGVDVIIVGRGGGSLEDLWPFNEESVARAIAASEIPIVSAVGHETDFTIADFVADVRAPTPTGAAAIILRDRNEIRDQLRRDMSNADRALSSVIERMRSRFGMLDARLSPERAQKDIDLKGMVLDDLWNRADRALCDQMADMRSRFTLADAKLSPASALREIEACRGRLELSFSKASPADARRMLDEKHSATEALFEKVSAAGVGILSASASRWSEAAARMSSLNPKNVLERGYSMVIGSDGRALTSISGMMVGEKVDIHMRDGTARATVKEVTEEKR